MVAQQSLELLVWVQIPAPQLKGRINMNGFQARFSKQQHARAKVDKANLVCLSIVGKHAKQDSIEFTGPVSQEHADAVAKLLNKIINERRAAGL